MDYHNIRIEVASGVAFDRAVSIDGHMAEADNAVLIELALDDGKATRVALAHIRQGLSHMNACYGEGRYPIFPLIQRQVFQGKNIHG